MRSSFRLRLRVWGGVLLAGLAFSGASGQEIQETPGPGALQPLPLGDVEASGWLRTQLEIQLRGLTGHLDEFWPDVRDSGWIGGSAEGWERMPYWLDGAVPLAFLLQDAELTARVRNHVDYILRHQQEDGWLGPERSPEGKYQARDPWPVFVMMKALTQYAEATGDSRVGPALRRFLLCLDRQLEERPLFDWNRMRWQDGVLSVLWLHERTTEPWLTDLAQKLRDQGFDWIRHFSDLPFKTKVEKWEHESHVVNNAMGAKTAAVLYRMTGDPARLDQAREALEVLDRYHGQVSGIFSGDECFAGLMPSQGTETCAVVEYMYSLEWIAAETGDPVVGDLLERVAFNALPAAVTPDWWGRQYVQQANQAVVKVSEDRVYTTNGEKANLFGLETNYGCCTANMHQGWPKFTSHLWMKTQDEGLAAVAYAPSRVRTALSGKEAAIELDTNYPFDSRLRFTVRLEQPLRFPLWLRIPGWVEHAAVDVPREPTRSARGATFVKIERTWRDFDRVYIELPLTIRSEPRFNRAMSLSRGPLVLSLQVGTLWKQLEGELPHADWEVFPTTHWNYALELDFNRLQESFAVKMRAGGDCVFCPDDCPVEVEARGRLLPEWTLERNAAEPPPESPVTTTRESQVLTLVPYGAAKLRISEFPWFEKAR